MISTTTIGLLMKMTSMTLRLVSMMKKKQRMEWHNRYLDGDFLDGPLLVR